MNGIETLLAVLCGGAVGFSLSLIGGGGSILAVPLLLYVAGVTEPHVAIGTSALAVSVNAFANFILHWRAGTVKWDCAAVFAGVGFVGAVVGSTLGKLVDGQRLLFLFAFLMIVVGFAMLRPRSATGNEHVQLNSHIAIPLALIGLGAGLVSGFFGIGGGFLIVPGIMFGSGMPIINAIGSSLLAVGTFALTTSVNYALSGFVDWRVALEFIAGGAAGGYFGMKAAVRLAERKRALTYIFVAVVFTLAAYILAQTSLSLAAA